MAFVSGTSGEVAAESGSSCWKNPRTRLILCADRLGPNPTTPLRVTQGETLSVRFTIRDSPSRVDVQRRDDTTPVSALPVLSVGNPTTFRADLPLGQSVVYISTRWHLGDAFYGVLLDVRAAAVPSPLRLTG